MKHFCFALLGVVLLACQKDRQVLQTEDAQVATQAAATKSEVTGGRPMTIQLTGAEEAPGPGDPDGYGTAWLTLNQGQGIITYKVEYANIATPMAAHIHIAPRGVAGRVVVPLQVVNGVIEGSVEVDKELIKDIRQNPEKYYLNVHNMDYMPGAIRGQLSK
ncbi:CHRD domain-containing protein [Flavisolibacter sp. BT320]|nr:CHRD domain-containing protein [Flavisolibacter longurius]